MLLTHRSCEDEDYEVYIKDITTKHMKQLFIENFGGFSEEVSEDKFFDVLMEGHIELFFLKDQSLEQTPQTYIGYISYTLERDDETSLLIHDIHVTDKHQDKGFGKQLLKHAQTYAQEQHLKQLKVFVFKNNPAHQFYERNGFKNQESLEKNHTFVMVKKLV